jgi:hypothetical protein
MTWQMMKNYGKYGKSKHEWYEFHECEGPTLRDTEIPRYRAVIWGRMASTWTNESQPPPWWKPFVSTKSQSATKNVPPLSATLYHQSSLKADCPGLANLAESTPLLSTMHWWSLAHIYCFSHLSFHNDNNTLSDWPKVGLLYPIQSDSIRVSAGTHLRDLARASWRDVCPSTQVDETRASWIYLIYLHCVKCPVSPVAATGESISPAKRAACIVQRIRD